ncbi:RDD family protein [Cellulomonas sp. KRMCY2]|uniref:RDD family protein n=1 Tax=Cellulomonas sp. KRMCY2 TaxID=1304865 RepID=UPI00045EA155|nr:RDD family protein [Cellulomonas sp. KRMCY2]
MSDGHQSYPSPAAPVAPARYPAAGPVPYPAAGPVQYPYASAPPPAPLPPLASWIRRVAAFGIDAGVPFLFVALVVGIATSVEGERYGRDTADLIVASAIVGAYVVAGGFSIWNRWSRQGRTGQTVGKRAMGIRLVGQRTLTPVGTGRAFCRDLAHNLDVYTVVGCFWPLWDARRQSFADMLCSTVVVRA